MVVELNQIQKIKTCQKEEKSPIIKSKQDLNLIHE